MSKSRDLPVFWSGRPTPGSVPVPPAVAAIAGGRPAAAGPGTSTSAGSASRTGGADLAIATWSAGWNYGPGWEPLLLDAYGVEPDPDRTAYYRLLWDLG